jgi:hydrogenase maturation factor
MCLALPGQIVEQDGFFAVVRIGKTHRKLLNAAEAKTGGWVTVENGMITGTMEKEEGKLMATAWQRKRKAKKKNE